MSDAAALARFLPHLSPEIATPQRTLLFLVRRMAIGGLHDAHAAAASIALFGLAYRRPLVLARALMQELARISARVIAIAPPCCLRMTEDEAALICAVHDANADAPGAHAWLEQLTGTPRCLGALSSAQAVEQAFRDLGRPLS